MLRPALLREFGVGCLPDPRTSEVYAALDGRVEPACFFVMERVRHAGPFVVREDLRGRGLARAMAERALSLGGSEEGYISALTPEANHLAESLGLVRVDGTLWCKERSDVR